MMPGASPAAARGLSRLALFLIAAALLPGAERIDLPGLMRQEAARRRAAAPSRLSVHDGNLGTAARPRPGYHFTLLVVDPLPAGGDTAAGSSTFSLTPVADRIFRKNREAELEGKIAEAQDNIARYESEMRTIEQDLAPYRLWDKPGYIREKTEELQRWIDGERLFIDYSRKRIDDLHR